MTVEVGGKPLVQLSWGSCTDVGGRRAVNEDSLLAAPPVFLVADGMGGHHAGDIASRIVIEEFTALTGVMPAVSTRIRDCLDRADDRISRLGIVDGRTAGTTVAAAVVVERGGSPYWLIVAVGDSRVYRLANGRLEQLSKDHSVIQELIDAGMEPAAASRHPQRHVVTRAVGSLDQSTPDYWLLPMALGDRLLICSDGLTSAVEDSALYEIMTAGQAPQQVADDLVHRAIRNDATDNITAVIVDVVTITAGADVEATQPRLSARRGVPRPGSGTELGQES